MGDYDNRIAVLREQRALANKDLEEIKRGVTHMRNGVDITERKRGRAEKIVADLDAVLATYEDLNADSP
jgi:butyrate kinase